MNRNEKCFCGSGKKYKHCHIDIEENSVIGDLVLLYNKLDNLLKNSKKPANCHAGCSNCCYHMFPVPLTEFIYACYGYKKLYGNNSIEAIINKGYNLYMAALKSFPKVTEICKNMESITSMEEYLKYLDSSLLLMEMAKLPCIFLNEETNLCTIYNYRPSVCRYHGIARFSLEDDTDRIHTCDVIPNGVPISDLINLDPIYDEFMEQSFFKSEKYDITMFDSLFPMFYFCYLFFTGKDNFRFKFDLMQKCNRSDYADGMFERNRKRI